METRTVWGEISLLESLILNHEKFPLFTTHPTIREKKLARTSCAFKKDINLKDEKKIDAELARPKVYWSIVCALQVQNHLKDYVWEQMHCRHCGKFLIPIVEAEYVYGVDKKHRKPSEIQSQPYYKLCLDLRKYILVLSRSFQLHGELFTDQVDEEWIENLEKFQEITFGGCCSPSCLLFSLEREERNHV